MKKIIIQQAYSTKNSGDGLLVDLTVELLNEVLENDEAVEYLIFANDKESFTKYTRVFQVDCVDKILYRRVLYSALNAIRIVKYLLIKKKFTYPLFDQNSKESHLIIGVGGGYMRGKNFKESLKCIINNTTQLLWAKSSGIPFIYFPQSIGPFKYKFHENIVLEGLKYSNSVHVRDDRSLKLCNLETTTRTPDLAVMKFAQNFELANALKKSGGTLNHLLICRDIEANEKTKNNYINGLKALKEKYKMEIVLQSTGRGNDDYDFARQYFGEQNLRTLKEALSDGKRYLVTSVRLHGSMETIISGHPSVHLSYERKGFGAYEDLGLENYVFNSFSLNVEDVTRAIDTITQDEDSYWLALEKNIKQILSKKNELKSNIRKALY
ncbi:hypothetical protein D210916BOD24_19170 [Alteromonas sp. D210916BOD_24]|uniref:polysaccharide pyruvyl transferase family protein n=1 Tax=Alteromonas sp. D210916BOD_24 TaxID=3157618 RepID=UPI00399D3829